MPGIGPAPLPADQLTGHGAAKSRDKVVRMIPSTPVKQPNLPAGGFTISAFTPGEGWSRTDTPWPEATKRWWKMWGESPLMTEATENDWSELMDTAIVHARHWNGDPTAAAELRQRVAKFGATPEDRLRLRIQFATAAKTEKSAGVPIANTGKGGNRRKLTG